jgi:hypothetical protein
MTVIIDRFEGDYAIVELENGIYVNVPKILLPNAKEGDAITIEIDQTKTNLRKEHIQNLMNNIFED